MRLVNIISDKDFANENIMHLVGFLKVFSQSKVELAQYSRLADISMQKVKIPQERGGIFSPTKILLLFIK
jgi:chromatin segregation and condensation protein Rec8/ScpA/Scc1 (kleisin family)